MEPLNYTIEVPKDKPEYRRAFILAILLDQSFDKSFLQRKRIEKDKRDNNLKVLFADIHFFLVSLSNLMEILKSLKSLLKTDQNLNAIYKKYIKDLEYLNDFRDHLEHITDKRLDGKNKKGQPLKNPGMLGNLWGDDYDFGGERFNLQKTFLLVENLSNDLKKWNEKSNVYPLWKINQGRLA